MSMTDPIGDMLTRIRNGIMAGKSEVKTPSSRARQRVLDVLEREGYILGYDYAEFENNKAELKIQLKYVDGASVISTINRVSKPGRRVYSSVNDLPRVHNGLGISIVSTPKGVLSDAEARDGNVGGEVLCTVF
ncbi:30S ribosomal protein S8 [Temperatibacter marinus]|uniref:Small ribosomal subunit protein uS8 n=1 Tax=Temperatibacter marinus TaxID=1456591 RepID=A0AA52HAI6_9PROT|nr:30S ribosomal protein S8 [Temperatibacter marinus]WND02780.1 30S ribosomal protein S8 [Temperatibacter marinus]